jgi:hypothetical protein
MDKPVTRMHHMLKDFRKKKLRASKKALPQVTLENGNNVVYVGPVEIGTPMQGSGKSAFVYDSGSGFLTVNGADCKTCED